MFDHCLQRDTLVFRGIFDGVEKQVGDDFGYGKLITDHGVNVLGDIGFERDELVSCSGCNGFQGLGDCILE